MNKFFIIFTFFTSLTMADTISELAKEFARRDSLKLTNEQGAAINFLRALKYPLESITAIETKGDIFFIQDHNSMTCFGSISEQTFRCINSLGILGQSTGDAQPASNSATQGAVEAEFIRRQSLTLTVSEQDVVEFLKTTLKYPVETITKLELLSDLSESFFIEDRNNMICFGSVREQMLRCKNEIGITGVTFTGDSD